MNLKLWAAGALALSATVCAHAQITSNPLPAPVVKKGLAVEVLRGVEGAAVADGVAVHVRAVVDVAVADAGSSG